ncbi:MAG: effector-associated domain 2-containing protein, partial [Sciscionella sp.]
SQAVNLAFRILDAQAAKVALAQSNGSLAVIASDSFYREVVLPDPAANPDAFRQIPVSIKQTDTVAWLLLPDSGGGSDTTGVRGRGQAGTSGGLFGLVDALLEVPCVRDDADRRLLLDLLSPRIANTVSYNPRARWHVLSLVRVCLNYDGGLAELVDAVRKMDGDSLAVRRLEAVVREWSTHPPD